MRALLIFVCLLVAACSAAEIMSSRPTTFAVPTTTPAVLVRCQYRESGALPDPVCTPGAVSQDVRQDNVLATICSSGYTASVRPSVSESQRLKREVMADYGLAGHDMRLYELDHQIPLELGGDPTSKRNLFPQLWEGENGARAKDRVENALRRDVCSGRRTLADAQHVISIDWRQAR